LPQCFAVVLLPAKGRMPGSLMMRIAHAVVLATGLSLPVAALAAVTPAKPIGPPQNCVQIANIQQTRVIDNKTIDFIMKDGRVLRNTLPNSCPPLGIMKSFGYKTSQAQLCNVDIITVITQGAGPVRSNSCGLGMFTPIEAPPKK
jgi:hypothetical protein